MRLVDDWRDALKWHSTQIAIIAASLPAAWAMMGDDLRSYIPDTWLPFIPPVMFVAFMIGRLRKQGGDE